MDDIIYGKNAVLEAVKLSNRNINKIIISKGMANDKKLNEIIEHAKSRKILFQFIPKEKFQKYNEYAHQGIIAFISPIQYISLDEFLERNIENAKIMFLDGVQDPHNLGAIIRTCVCAGYDAIILPQRKNASVTPVVDKTSAGAINHIPIISVNSPSSAIEKLKNNNYWIIATDASAKDNYFDVDYTNMNFALVLGGEESGVSKTILNKSDFIVKIPMFNNFNSLNVSAAASVVVFESIKQTLQNTKNNV